MMKVDILAIGAHADDVEIGCGGSIVKHVEMGYSVGIIDLTKGELGTRGKPETREKEAQDARGILGASFRENMGFRDGFFINDEEHQLRLVKKIREFKPGIILCNALDDRHPDHGRAASLVKDSCFLSGLQKIDTSQEAWRPRFVLHYIQAKHIEPDVVVDISEVFERKMDSIKAFRSQFYNPHSEETETFISDKGFFDFIEGRAKIFGKIINREYGEGFISDRYIGCGDLMKLI